jgi:peroxiredoxin
MKRRACGLLAAVFLLPSLVAPRAARAVLHEGDLTPDFHKTDLDGIPHTLFQYRGQVVVLFLLGWDCPVCIPLAPQVEAEVWQHYQAAAPGQVQVLGPDLWNGSQAQLEGFRFNTGVTFPLLLNSGAGVGDENLYTPYGQFDNFVVVNKQGIIRYHAYDRWPHGNRYHLDEIRGCVDSLVTMGMLDVDGGPGSRLALSATPNPFRGSTTIELSNPGGEVRDARVSVHDLAGRRIATLWSGRLGPGTTRMTWGGRGREAGAVAPGVYLITADVGGTRLGRRVVVLE